MEKFFKTITGNSVITGVVLIVIVLYMYDQYHSKTFFGLFPPKTV